MKTGVIEFKRHGGQRDAVLSLRENYITSQNQYIVIILKVIHIDIAFNGNAFIDAVIKYPLLYVEIE